MRTRTAVLLILGTLQVGLGTSLVATAQKAVIDKAFDAVIGSRNRDDALATMESIAAGKSREFIKAVAAKAGLLSYIDDTLPLDALRTRRYALERIGETDLPEALDYLKNLTQGQVGPEDSTTIYPGAKLALQKALLRREEEPNHQISFLEQKIIEPSGFLVAMWAVDELCDRGSLGSTTTISTFLMHRYPGPTGDDMVAFCKARMDVINRSPDRAKALGWALRIDSGLQERRLLGWAIGQLIAMGSEEADGILDRYASEVEAKFPDVPAVTSVPENMMHFGFAQNIRLARSERLEKRKAR